MILHFNFVLYVLFNKKKIITVAIFRLSNENYICNYDNKQTIFVLFFLGRFIPTLNNIFINSPHHISPAVNDRRSPKNVFDGLKKYLDHASQVEREYFYSRCIPIIIKRAVAIERLKPKEGIPFLSSQDGK